ncbi:hypothetical protein BABINDRAFT_8606 [Babjeviella inositovora NRRL Y-12698]|uniref:Non-canonical E2 ubiquitin-conjugating enzyme C-terminal domain-containing protein n=1 Tax=Babjeviella inositovora NRRL Y-12698 TaxID=984486 RepID=A0A1E3QNG4_9ASCO|nr:uncharacterized protein BABINDRAFT_8606 [Babjeviella inositovora NRRL Y-12698]ODQ78984.1 hypothetical protein BABINDRAFT_8606 [Babjeviella inositovora NRRL Y-12698]
MPDKPTLCDILQDDAEISEADETHDVNESESEREVDENFCVECTDMPSEVVCVPCDENYCKVCWEVIHRSGKRRAHKTKKLKLVQTVVETEEQDQVESLSESSSDEEEMPPTKDELLQQHLGKLREHAKYIPMRLTSEERKLLRLLEAALNVSEYTDRIDILSYKTKAKRIISEIKEVCSILAGLVVASDFKAGQTLIEDKDFADNAEWYQTIFEIGRRYKIMNPEKMRDSFGKLCFIVMDSRAPEVAEHLEFHLHKPIKTVHGFLTSKTDGEKALQMFDDPLILDAVSEVNPVGLSRHQIQRLIKQKESAIERISTKYCSSKRTRTGFTSFLIRTTEETIDDGFTKEEIRQVLYSIGDVNAYVRSNRAPIARMLVRLEENFSSVTDPAFSLSIRNGVDGARLSHNHEKQFHFCAQSLSLWSILMRDFIQLWSLADNDLLSENRYRLADTGQGLQRIKPAPKVSRAMHKVLNEVQRKTVVPFVGSSAVHIGDTAVPSALTYLDKYLQVPRILNPIDTCLNFLDVIYPKDKFVAASIDSQYQSLDNLKKVIMTDFFRHAFDGSGAQDYFNAGSCIDGRLTSCWNWANEISKKNYYKFFLLSGFIGFNGTDGW